MRFIVNRMVSYLQMLSLVHVLGHLPLIVHITAGPLQLPSAVHIIFATPVRSYPISHRCVAQAP